MTPEKDYFDALFFEGVVEGQKPSKSYKMQIEEAMIIGSVDGKEALEQMVYKCINTEPDYPIYANFGVKKKDLFGRPKRYAYMEVTRRIKEVLELDDRIERVHSFVYREDWSKGEDLGFTFKIDSIYGEIKGQEVLEFAG